MTKLVYVADSQYILHRSRFVWVRSRETLHSSRHYDVSHSGRALRGLRCYYEVY